MRVGLLGGLAVDSESGHLGEDDLPGRQARLLLAYLIAAPNRPVPRSELADVLWGENLPATWEKSLTVIVSRLRNALSVAGLDDAIVLRSAFGCYELELPSGTQVDIVQARDSVVAAERLLADEHHDAAGVAAARALDLCSGIVLPGESGAWIDARRVEMHDLELRALSCQSEAAIRRGDMTTAVTAAKRASELDPFGETRLTLLMRVYSGAGERSKALLTYDEYRRRLADELGVDPAPETQQLYLELLSLDTAIPRPPRTGELASGAATSPSQSLLADGGPPSAPPIPAAPMTAPPFGRSPRRHRWFLLPVVVAVLATSGGVAAVVTDRTPKPRPSSADSLLLLSPSGPAHSVSLPGTPAALAFGLGSVWVADPSEGTVIRVDARAAQIRDQIEIGGRPTAITTTSTDVWITRDDGKLLRIDPVSGSVVQTIAVGDGPTAVVGGSGSLWIANTLDATVSQIDERSGELVRTINVPVAPTALAYGFGAVWVVSPTAQSLSRIDATTGEVTQTATIGGLPVAVSATDHSLLVADAAERAVRRVDPQTVRVVDTVDLPVTPVDLATAAGHLWVAGGTSGVVVSLTQTLANLHIGRESGDADAVTATPDGAALAVGAPIGSHLGGTLTVVGGENPQFATLDANANYDALASQLLLQVGDGLLGFARTSGLEGNTIVPDLATYVPTPTGKGLTYTFQLREGIRFSDGTPLTAGSVRRGVERALSLQPAAAQFFSAIRGAQRCTVGHLCSLADGIAADDQAGTVTFHLRYPDDQFLQALAFPMAFAVPASTPFTNEATQPPPTTGPYRVTAFTPGKRAVLERNPYFHQWSAAAQPAGYPDRIIWTATSPSPESGADVTLSLSGSAIATSILNQPADVHVYRQPLVFFAYLNNRVAPFNDIRVRRAVDYAINRNRSVELLGGFTAAEPTCQVIPAGFPGYHPYCPFPGPQLAKARALVHAAHATGAPVEVLATTTFEQFDRYLVQVLNQIGLRAHQRVVSIESMFTQIYAPHTRVQASSYYWLNDLPSPAYNLPVNFSCAARLGPTPSNTSGFCSPALDRAMSAASHLEAAESPLASHRWASIDRQLTDAAVEIPVANFHGVDLVSERVHNYQAHPLWGLLLDQLWH